MKVLTLTQPYASLVAGNYKRIETRSWRTEYRGELAIHAAKGLKPVDGMDGLISLVGKPYFLLCLKPLVKDCYRQGIERIAQALPLGAIVATCQLVDCVPTYHINLSRELEPSRVPDGLGGWNISEQEWAFGDYSDERFAWLLEDIKPLRTPIPCKGALSLWTPDDLLIAQVREELTP